MVGGRRGGMQRKIVRCSNSKCCEEQDTCDDDAGALHSIHYLT